MKKIRLCDEDFGMFDDELSPTMYDYFLRHKDAFKQMWQDQGRKFWARFLYCFRSFTLRHCLMKDFPAKPEHHEEIFEGLFKYIYNEFVKGKVSHAKNLVIDIAVVAQSRHLIPNLESRSFAKDPFYHKETRDVYRRLFGPPGEKESLLKVYFFLSTYLKFGGSVVECLRQWVGADLCSSDDESYWHGPNMTTVESAFTIQGTKINKEKESVNPVDIYSDYFDLTRDGEVMYKNELMIGSPHGPRFIKGWVYGDPRLVSTSENPLYDKNCDGSGDWRKDLNKIMYLRFLVFCKNWLRHDGEKKIENILSESFFKASITDPKAERKKSSQKLTSVENGRKKTSPPPSAKSDPKNMKGSAKPKPDAPNGSNPGLKKKSSIDPSPSSGSNKSSAPPSKENPGETIKSAKCTVSSANHPRIIDFCQNAEADKHALDQSLRALLPRDLIPECYKIVHAEEVQDDSLKNGEKRIRLIAVNHKGKRGKKTDQLIYTITFPTPSTEAEPEVRIDFGAVNLEDSVDELVDLKMSSDKQQLDMSKKDLKPAENGEVKSTCNDGMQDVKPAETCKVASSGLKKDGPGVKPKVKYHDGMSDVMGPLNGALEGATGGFSFESTTENGRRICTTCCLPEPKPKTYKKCQKCKDLNVRKPRYYCSRECQLIDWRDRHKHEHKEGLLELKSA